LLVVLRLAGAPAAMLTTGRAAALSLLLLVVAVLAMAVFATAAGFFLCELVRMSRCLRRAAAFLGDASLLLVAHPREALPAVLAALVVVALMAWAPVLVLVVAIVCSHDESPSVENVPRMRDGCVSSPRHAGSDAAMQLIGA